MISRNLRNKINNRLRKIIFKGGQTSYSQAGEDMILDCIFLSKKSGFYIDIGANHPVKASNTYFFYSLGWTGINIDALPEAIQIISFQRKNDINIHSGVSDTEGIMNFYTFKESSYNTFNEKIVDEIKKTCTLIDVKKIKVQTLATILDKYNISSIDFMSVDVEGLDLNVLKSNNWERYRPKVVLVEDFNYGIQIVNSKVYQYMLSIGYHYFCQTVTNTFYIDSAFLNERFIKKQP